MIRGFITFSDFGRGYAVALSDDQKNVAIIHKSCFDKCGQPFRTSATPQAVQFKVGSVLRRDSRTGVTHAIASEVRLA